MHDACMKREKTLSFQLPTAGLWDIWLWHVFMITSTMILRILGKKKHGFSLSILHLVETVHYSLYKSEDKALSALTLLHSPNCKWIFFHGKASLNINLHRRFPFLWIKRNLSINASRKWKSSCGQIKSQHRSVKSIQHGLSMGFKWAFYSHSLLHLTA